MFQFCPLSSPVPSRSSLIINPFYIFLSISDILMQTTRPVLQGVTKGFFELAT